MTLPSLIAEDSFSYIIISIEKKKPKEIKRYTIPLGLLRITLSELHLCLNEEIRKDLRYEFPCLIILENDD